MEKQKIQLKFDDFQSNLFDVNCGFFQKSPISPILWLIYVKHLHLEIKLKFKRNFMSYIDDVIIYVNGKNIKKNCKLLTKIAKSLFDWAEKNHVIFDNDKFELIHFEKSRKGSNDKMILPNGKILTPQMEIKYLGF